jgi:hypothetical protein
LKLSNFWSLPAEPEVYLKEINSRGKRQALNIKFGIIVCNWGLPFIVILFSFFIYSTQSFRLKLLDYHLYLGYYDMAVDGLIRMTRKGIVLSNESKIRICANGEDRTAVLVEEQTTFARKQWNESRTFFAYDENNFGKLFAVFDKIRSIEPYNIRLGFIDNDLNPAHGVLSNFDYIGGIALDYNLRSIGADLKIVKPIVAMRLLKTTKETRVKPENLSLWISNDNRLYRRYSGRISYFTESKAMTLDHLDIVGQFVKIHCDINDDKYTFGVPFNNILNIYGPPRNQGN